MLNDSMHEKLLTYNDSLDFKEVKKEHWFWDNWVLLSLSATFCFSFGNIIISYLSHFGLAATFYFSGGAFCYSVLYFCI